MFSETDKIQTAPSTKTRPSSTASKYTEEKKMSSLPEISQITETKDVSVHKLGSTVKMKIRF
jgi:hypothetical protein